MKTKNIIEGMSILIKYYDREDGHNTAAEHDQIYMYRTDRPVTMEDFEKLEELGWFQDEVEDDEGYDPQESWSVYV